MRLHTVFVCLLLVLVVWLAGCSRTPTRLPTPDTPVVSSSPSATFTASFTPSPFPSATPTIELPSPTPSPRPTLTPFATEISLEVVGQIGGHASAVAVKDKIAYLGVGPQVLVLDVSDPHSPKQIGQSGMLPGLVKDIAVDNGYAE